MNMHFLSLRPGTPCAILSDKLTDLKITKDRMEGIMAELMDTLHEEARGIWDLKRSKACAASSFAMIEDIEMSISRLMKPQAMAGEIWGGIIQGY